MSDECEFETYQREQMRDRRYRWRWRWIMLRERLFGRWWRP